ncbi:MAG: hypothetical protein HY028_01465 [Gammaproteobacteria bacterium]|nr:hypothetical protein [Gammaproteobacteria bacterium]
MSISRNPNGLGSARQSVRVHSTDDYTGKVLLSGLEADTAAIRDINGTIKYQTTLAPVIQH